MNMSNEELLRVTELTRQGQVMEATRAIQRALGLVAGSAPAAQTTAEEAPQKKEFVFKPHQGASDEVVDAPFRGAAQPSSPTSSFQHGEFSWGSEVYRYRLFVPSARPGVIAAPLPLVVMLHGCKQDAADFAQGTAMNSFAEQQNCLVLYPEQLTKANTMRCWNWFEPAHQTRGSGEPAMIAALARQIAGDHGGDVQRIYIAGLSAGGAMAALTAGLYPEVFAAVGVHSGLPTGAATDVVSAFTAMHKGAQKVRRANVAVALPTIVFHGTDDKTVAPGNADSILDDGLAALARAGIPVQKAASPVPPAEARQRTATRTTFTGPGNKILLESWSIAAGPHAWSGGDAQGSFTDPLGPSASAAMLAFFLQHARGQAQP